MPDRGDKEKLRVTTIALKSENGRKKSVGERERERGKMGERRRGTCRGSEVARISHVD